MNKLILSFAIFFSSGSLLAQTITDGLMMPKKDFCTGFLYSHDQWKDYWEGSLKRDNQNIGTITTTQITWVGSYGVTDKINVIAMLPYIKTSASDGTLTGLEGIQDLTIAIKYNLLKKDIGSGNLSLFGVGSFSTPLTNYTPDLLPLSIGLASTTASGRLTAYYKLNKGWYANASAGYVWRSNVSLDRPSYFTDGNIYNTNQVWMPNQIAATYSLGYQKYGLIAEIYLSTQNTLGGGDIRRQDMPFVSNRMDFVKAGATALYYLPKPKGLAMRVQFSYTLSGLNVGQSTTLMGGLLYTIHFAKKQ
jgi:Putative MetA-pathway of phenol degradation